MDQTITIADGDAFKQYQYETSPVAKDLVKIVQSLSAFTDPEELITKTCLAARDLFPQSTITCSKILEEKIFLHRVIDFSGEIYDQSLILKSRKFRYGVVPENSITARVAATNRPNLWVEGGNNRSNDWFKLPVYFGVPYHDEAGAVAGVFVVSFRGKEIPTDEQIFSFQAIAEAFSISFTVANRYQDSIKAGQVIEREIIAQRLHDSVAQGIFSMQMKVRKLLRTQEFSESATRDIEELQVMIDKARGDLGQVIASGSQWGKNDASLDEFVYAAIRKHEEAGGPPAVYVQDKLPELPEEVKNVVCSLVCEALANVRKHAQASIVSIRLTTYQNALIVVILDDGKGLHDANLDVEGNGFHFGIKNLSRMVEALGGSFCLTEVDEGAGVMVKATIPLQRGDYGKNQGGFA